MPGLRIDNDSCAYITESGCNYKLKGEIVLFLDVEALYNELKGNSSKIENKEVKNYIKDHGNGPHCDSF